LRTFSFGPRTLTSFLGEKSRKGPHVRRLRNGDSANRCVREHRRLIKRRKRVDAVLFSTAAEGRRRFSYRAKLVDEVRALTSTVMGDALGQGKGQTSRASRFEYLLFRGDFFRAFSLIFPIIYFRASRIRAGVSRHVQRA